MPLYTSGGGTDATLTFTDITTNNSSTTKHGFLKKLDNSVTNFMNGTGDWSAPGISAAGLNAGTSFPGGPATNDLFFRTDLGLIFTYTGTIWYTVEVFKSMLIIRESVGTIGDYSTAISATASGTRAGAPSVLGASDIYLTETCTRFVVASGGTALGASHKWVGTLVAIDTNAGAISTPSTINIASGSSAVWRTVTVAINAAQPAGTLFYQMTYTKTGTPGTLTEGTELYYRIIGV